MTRHLPVLMGFHDYLSIDREAGIHPDIRKPGDQGSNLESTHFDEWDNFSFTTCMLTRAAKRVY